VDAARHAVDFDNVRWGNRQPIFESRTPLYLSMRFSAVSGKSELFQAVSHPEV